MAAPARAAAGTPSVVSWSVNAMALSPASRARRATSSGGNSPSEAFEWQCRSTNAVRARRGGPGRLGVTEQIQERSLTQLGEGSVRAAVADRRITGVAPLAVRPGAELEHEGELILTVHRHAAGTGYLPRLAINDGLTVRHAHASASPAHETSIQQSPPSRPNQTPTLTHTTL